MKRFFLITFLLSCTMGSVWAQCNEYYQFQGDSEWEMENYSAKGKLQSRVNQKVKEFNSTGTGFKAVVLSKTYNDKGKELASMDLNFKCDNGIMYVDMRNFVSEEQLKVFDSQEMVIEGENLEFPNSLTVGQTLKDASVKMTSSGGMPINLTIKITDRKVIGKESVTTPLGTFDTYVLTSKNHIKMMVNMEITTKEWLAPKVGVVKSESYRNDKLMGYSLLTKRK